MQAAFCFRASHKYSTIRRRPGAGSPWAAARSSRWLSPDIQRASLIEKDKTPSGESGVRMRTETNLAAVREKSEGKSEALLLGRDCVTFVAGRKDFVTLSQKSVRPTVPRHLSRVTVREFVYHGTSLADPNPNFRSKTSAPLHKPIPRADDGSNQRAESVGDRCTAPSQI
jgi:hypothetical protein